MVKKQGWILAIAERRILDGEEYRAAWKGGFDPLGGGCRLPEPPAFFGAEPPPPEPPEKGSRPPKSSREAFSRIELSMLVAARSHRADRFAPNESSVAQMRAELWPETCFGRMCIQNVKAASIF